MPELELSDEQAMLMTSARDRMAAVGGLPAVRTFMDSELGHDPALYREFAQLGWLGVAVAEAYGGAGLGVGSLVALAEPMGRALSATPWLSTALAGELLSRAGSEAQKQAWLPKLVSGEAVFTAALTEHSASFQLDAPELDARRDGSGYRLTGSKLLVLDALAADLIVLSARLVGQPALFLLDKAALPADELALRREVLIDETRRAYRLDLDGLAVPDDARLAGGDAAGALRRVYELGALLVAAEMAGGAAGVMDLTLEYLQTRKQFGKPIGGYQALKHPMVDILVMYEQARSLLYHAATAIDRDPARAATAIHMAKAQCGDTFTHAADRAIQFHGAIGFTHECHAQLFFRRAQWAEYTFGDSRHHRRRLEGLLLDGRA